MLEWLRRVAAGPSTARPTESAAEGFGFPSTLDAKAFDALSAAELSALEDRDVPSIERDSDTSERADEKQEVTASVNFPLHWTSARLSWNYLFDFAVACELLAPRPDDLVLDFAAGTCWATELLTRVGVRTVSIDLSVEMMRRGRQRLSADSRLVFRDSAAFVAARGQALPFGDATFDAVLCMNALHHLPSYAVALKEILRILKPGGRAVFSEPGSSHATEALSQFRMRGENVIEKAVILPIIHRRAMDAGFTRMRVVPLRSSSAYAFDYSATAADGPALATMWTETLRLSPGEHARFVLHKGPDRPADTLLPAHQLGGRLAARLVLHQGADRVPAGASFTDRLRVKNTGSVTWKAVGRRFGGQVTCGLKVCDESGTVLREDLGRTPLPRDVAPDEEIDIAMVIGGELAEGRYRLRYDMIVEGVTWFEHHGSPCPERLLEVEDAGYAAASTVRTPRAK